MGVNSYITKPATFRELVDVAGDALGKYWFELVELPSNRNGRCHEADGQAQSESCWSRTTRTTFG